jgi:putative protein-disulfide isomerase
MQRLHEEYRNALEFVVISGGMVRGSRIGPIGEVAPYISWAYKEVEQRTGVRFGEGFLQGVLADGSSVFTSLPAAHAMVAFKSFQPENAIAFAHLLQHAVYSDGVEPSKHESFIKYAASFGLDEEEFLRQMLASHTAEQAEAEFALSTQLGITGFPTVLLQQANSNKLMMITQGFTDYQTLKHRMDAMLVGEKAL